MKKTTILFIVLFCLVTTTIGYAGTYVTEELIDEHGNTWVVNGLWEEVDGQRVFYPSPPTGQVWVDTSRFETQTQIIEKTEYITVRDTIYTPTATLRQAAVGNHEIIMTLNNPNYFNIKVNVYIKSLSPDSEVRNEYLEQEVNDLVLSPGTKELTFDSVKRHEGFTNYEIIVRVTENLHPDVHPDYEQIRELGSWYPDVPLYIEFLYPEVTLNTNNASSEGSFGTDWTFRNPNTIDFEYKLEIDDARGRKTLETGTISPGQTIRGSEIAIPTKDRTNTQTFIGTFDYSRSAPSIKESQDSFTFNIASAGISLSSSKSDVAMQTDVKSESTGCRYGPDKHDVTYTWFGASYTVSSSVSNNSNIPISVTVNVGPSSASYNLAPNGSTSGPSTSDTTENDVTIDGDTKWHTHTDSDSESISVTGWKKTAEESYSCNPPPPDPDDN
ncbi:hypothetical protein [Chengkuizengella axinellae]|uniref:Uncharacterized protein n=1 Tax=Chengkuizengella axinellae TaxID=3064388 RepID=A0ABT9J3C9_9BACL|nr:hypothetical protein [Chengkuizengella sp. 2205SS18-9]MDP5276117.1 hypothetical protein [Chengkuizengella sp. 2205SS18-9]